MGPPKIGGPVQPNTSNMPRIFNVFMTYLGVKMLLFLKLSATAHYPLFGDIYCILRVWSLVRFLFIAPSQQTPMLNAITHNHSTRDCFGLQANCRKAMIDGLAWSVAQTDDSRIYYRCLWTSQGQHGHP